LPAEASIVMQAIRTTSTPLLTDMLSSSIG
jgi:hypothetical protein